MKGDRKHKSTSDNDDDSNHLQKVGMKRTSTHHNHNHLMSKPRRIVTNATSTAAAAETSIGPADAVTLRNESFPVRNSTEYESSAKTVRKEDGFEDNIQAYKRIRVSTTDYHTDYIKDGNYHQQQQHHDDGDGDDNDEDLNSKFIINNDKNNKFDYDNSYDEIKKDDNNDAKQKVVLTTKTQEKTLKSVEKIIVSTKTMDIINQSKVRKKSRSNSIISINSSSNTNHKGDAISTSDIGYNNHNSNKVKGSNMHGRLSSSIITSSTHEISGSRRRRSNSIGHGNSVSSGSRSSGNKSMKSTYRMNIENSHKASSSSSSSSSLSAVEVSLLYEEEVLHSTLGLELSLRLLHKFTGHRYDYDEYTIIYIYNLGCDYMAYDSYVLMDAKYLHTSSQVYIETTSHILLLEAYLSSWLKSSISLSCYNDEFIIHGTIGYLLNFYCEEVYGEDDGRYRYQKMYDTVINLEKMGRGYSLISFFPENYENFHPYFNLYMKCKSTVLFQLIENRVGGKDPMRIVIKHIIKSPALYKNIVSSSSPSSSAVTKSNNNQWNGVNDVDVINNFQTLLNISNNNNNNDYGSSNTTPPTPSMINNMLGELSSYHNQNNNHRLRANSDDDRSSTNGALSPYLYGFGSPYSYNGSMSPYIYHGNASPYPNYGNTSPYAQHPYMGNTSPYAQHPYMGNTSPYAQYLITGGNLFLCIQILNVHIYKYIDIYVVLILILF